MTDTCAHCQHRKESGPGCAVLVFWLLVYLFMFLPLVKLARIEIVHNDERITRLEKAAGLPPLPSPAPPSFVPWKFPESSR